MWYHNHEGSAQLSEEESEGPLAGGLGKLGNVQQSGVLQLPPCYLVLL